MVSFIQGERVAARFVLIEKRGGSGATEVWRALDESSGAQVALKVVLRDCADQQAWESLQREFAISQRLRKAAFGIRVVRVDEPVRVDDAMALPMQLAASDARSLRGKPCARIVPVLIDVAEALHGAHMQGIIHRDLKPANVLLDFRGRALLADFGIASIDGLVPEGATHSPFSASPEQVAGLPASIADDVYGFGAMALELLTGYPPNFPNGDELSAYAHPVPEALHALLTRSVAREVQTRPKSMHEVLETLIALDLREVDVDASAMLDRIVPSAASEVTAARVVTPSRGAWGWAGAALLVASLLMVFLWLPRLAVGTAVQSVTDRPGVSSETAQALLTSQRDDEGRRQFLQTRVKFYESLEKLELRGAANWSGLPFAAAKSLGESADHAEREGHRDVALDRLQTAQQRLERIANESGKALQAQLAQGASALAGSRLDEARAAYALAAQIDPGNVTATKGIARIARLEPVVERLAEGEAALLEGEALHALQLFEQVLRADDENALARAGVGRAKAMLGTDRYAREVGSALQELRNGNAKGAREAFARAKALQPDGIEVREGLIQLESLDARIDLDGLRRATVQLESAERWAEALARYESLIAHDASLVFAREGAVRVRPRAELARRLDGLIGNPARLGAPEVRGEADALIARATAVAGDAPRLKAQVAALREQLVRYDIPVRIVIQSDGATQVSIQKVRNLGTVTRAELDLKPGRYVLLGTRNGYRDVRREVLLKPGEPPSVVELRCSEAIS